MNRHDRNYEIILKDVMAKVKQVSCNIQEVSHWSHCSFITYHTHCSRYTMMGPWPVSVCQQEPLQTLTLFAVSGELQSYSEVCETLSTLEVALGFLAMTGGEPHMQLSCYLEEVLQMGNQMAPHILKVSLSKALVIFSCCTFSHFHKIISLDSFFSICQTCCLRAQGLNE